MSFASEVHHWTTGTADDIEELRKNVMLELFNSVILDTPVMTGRLRGNWTISNGAPDSGTFVVTKSSYDSESKSRRTSSGPVTLETLHKVSDHIRNLKPEDQSVFLANNLDYAYKVEFDGWSSVKAPKGMLVKNFIRVTNLLARGRV